MHYNGGQYYYDLETLNWMSTMSPDLPKVKLSGDGVNLIVGGLGAHVVALDQDAENFSNRLSVYLASLRRLLRVAQVLQEKGEVSTLTLFYQLRRLIHQQNVQNCFCLIY